ERLGKVLRLYEGTFCYRNFTRRSETREAAWLRRAGGCGAPGGPVFSLQPNSQNDGIGDRDLPPHGPRCCLSAGHF
ncbi:hypothetical protein ETH_00038680, partial [Eimeria tenella]